MPACETKIVPRLEIGLCRQDTVALLHNLYRRIVRRLGSIHVIDMLLRHRIFPQRPKLGRLMRRVLRRLAMESGRAWVTEFHFQAQEHRGRTRTAQSDYEPKGGLARHASILF